MPWTHYRDEAVRLLRVDTHTSAASERELMRVRNAIVQVGKAGRMCVVLLALLLSVCKIRLLVFQGDKVVFYFLIYYFR